ncbi:DinB family protein [Leucobacter sp. wl10]|uniref:mycothiol transferase n=1 Tax=Leucobacter sp. wl10 TaxID=2304677 RepID=UPI000E5C55D7|nr:DinB family protein [Leucobacter sp. wl10]RGE18848.1 DUF664 domain-containing protein [Leucobacter sp. wl10]
MNATEILKDLADRPRRAAEMLRGSLTPELLNAHPHHDNSIAWLLWHAARELDEQLAALSGRETVWLSDGFDRRFALDLGPHEMGYGHTARQARAVEVGDPELLLEHLSAVVGAQIAYLESLDDAALAEVVDEGWDPPVTRASRLVSISVDAAEHVAQAAYIAGMGPGAFE